MSLDRDGFLAALLLKRNEVTIGQGQTVWVRELTASEVAKFVKLQRAGNEEELFTHVLTRTLQLADGQPMFGKDDAAKVAALPAKVSGVLMEAALELSGLTEPKKA